MLKILRAGRDVVIMVSCTATAICCAMAAYDGWRIGQMMREREREARR